MAKKAPERRYFLTRDWLEEEDVLHNGNADHLRYMNHKVAKMFENSKEDEITETWIMHTLLEEVQEGRIQYGEALALRDMYPLAVKKVKHFFSILES